MSAERDALDTLIESATDGRAIDWTGAESSAPTSAARAKIRALRDLTRIADFNRTLQRGASAPESGVPPARWGDLLVLESVGSGASGDVYRAWELPLQREVALKLLRPAADGANPSATLLEEARALARVHHPGVVAVHGIGEHDGRPGMWMEYLHGRTLEGAVASGAGLPAAEVLRIGRTLARALAAIHAADVLHRDLKPANVLLAGDGRVVLMDFGLGQRGASGPLDHALWSGTPLYMSPARLNGAAAGASDDLYALGVTLRVALTGRAPFEARTLDALRDEVTRGPARTLASECPGAPRALIAAIDRAMDPDASRRFPNAEAFALALEAIPDGAAAATPPPRNAFAWPLAIAAVIAVAAIATYAQRPRPSAPTNAPAPAVAPTVAATPAGAPYDVSVEFRKRGASGDVPLAAGDRVGPGDKLTLAFHASRPAWVYVLDADDRGETYLLFPQPMFDRKNPVPADAPARLPGTIGGRENAWTVTSRGGHEHFLVVASPQPVAELEAELGKLPAPERGRAIEYARVGGAAIEQLRGVGGVSELPAAPAMPGPSSVFERFRSLAGREEGVHGVWIRQITLANPLR